METPLDDAFVAVFCEKCGEQVGFVVAGSHDKWICPKCTKNREWEAVDLPEEEPTEK